jgi:hypothetical protein
MSGAASKKRESPPMELEAYATISAELETGGVLDEILAREALRGAERGTMGRDPGLLAQAHGR